MTDGPSLPGWPAVLHEEWAAAYVALSPSTFRAQVAPVVPAIHLTQRRIGWLRTDLDDWVARRRGNAATSPLTNPWDAV